VCDVVITVTMVIIVRPSSSLLPPRFYVKLLLRTQLSEYRAATPWKGTDSLITKLIYNTVETGAVTSIVAVADVVLFITLPSTNLHQWP
jgi:hypothetical protein